MMLKEHLNQKLICIISCAILFSLALTSALLTTQSGAHLSPDSLGTYISTAQHLHEGKGFTMGFDNHPSYAPPMFPLLIDLLMHLGLDDLQAGRLVPIISYALFVVVIFFLGRAVGGSLVGYLSSVACLVHPRLFQFAATVWSEMPFILFSTASLWLLVKYLMDCDKRALLILSAFLASLAALTRYVGLALIPVELIAIIAVSFARRLSAKDKILNVSLCMVFAGLPAFLWLYRNYVAFGSPFATFSASINVGSAVEAAQNFPAFVNEYVELLITMGRIIWRDFASLAYQAVSIQIAGILAMGLLILVIVKRLGRQFFTSYLKSNLLLLWYIAAYWALLDFKLSLGGGMTFLRGDGPRVMGVIYPFLIIAGISFFVQFYRTFKKPWLKAVSLVLILAISGTFIIPQAQASWHLYQGRKYGTGFNSPFWRNNDTINWLKQHVPHGVPIYTNSHSINVIVYDDLLFESKGRVSWLRSPKQGYAESWIKRQYLGIPNGSFIVMFKYVPSGIYALSYEGVSDQELRELSSKYGDYTLALVANTPYSRVYQVSYYRSTWCLASGEGTMEPLDQGGVQARPFGRNFEVDDFRIYARALSTRSIVELFQDRGIQEGSVVITKPVAHWEFDEGEGDMASDETGHHSGRLWGASWTEGKTGSALKFYGADDHVEITDKFDLSEETTISSWIKLNANEISNPGIAVIASSLAEDEPFTGYAVYVWNDNRLAVVVGNDERRVEVLSDGKVPSDNKWHHVAVTFSDRENEVRFYIDGKPAGADTITLKPLVNTGPLIIGGTRRGKTAPVEIRYPCNGSLNITEHIFALKIKANDATILSVELRATDGNDYLIRYLPGDGPVSVDGREITYYLGDRLLDGEWYTIERNLEMDLYEAVGVHFEHVKFLALRGSSYSVADLDFGTGIPEEKEVAVEGPVGVREVNLESMRTKPPELPVDPELGIAVPPGSVMTSQAFRFEKGEYIIDIVAKGDSISGTHPTVTVSLNDELGKRAPEVVDEFEITEEDFKKYSTRRVTIYVPRLLSAYVSVEDGEVPDLDNKGVEDGKVWIKKILIRKIVNDNDEFSNYTFYTQWRGDRLAFVVEDGDRKVGVLSDRGLGSADEWHHVALTFGIDYQVKFYIGGKLAGTDTISLRSSVRTRPLMLGAHVEDGSSRFYFNGVMDDLRIYNNALTESEIEGVFRQGREAAPEEGAAPSQLDLVKYWIFDEGGVQTSSTKLDDENVILHGDWPKAAQSDVGLMFDGVDDYIEISGLGTADTITDEFTISAWVKMDELGVGWEVLVQSAR